jgi:peroxiredoxin
MMIGEASGGRVDNINVIRSGFFTPQIKLPDTNGDIDDPIDRTGTVYTALVFINADTGGAEFLKSLEAGLPKTYSGDEIKLSAVVPVKFKIGKAFRERNGIESRVFCDSDLRLGTAFSVIDSSKAKPSYYPVVFVVGDEGSVRYRQVFDERQFDLEHFRSAVGRLI